MNLLIVPDKFKECLTAQEVADSIERGILNTGQTGLTIQKIPVADGGEGTVEALVNATGGTIIPVPAHDPLGRPMQSFLGLSADGQTAFIELAAASGLTLLSPAERNPLHTSTFGTGELLLKALDFNVNHIILGIGGSATTDGGTGLAEALGVVFRNSQNELIRPLGGNLSEIASIDMLHLDNRLLSCKIDVACDVDNPLTGERGAARVFAPQKGADAAGVVRLENNLTHLGRLIEGQLGVPVLTTPGAGAAGGAGAGLLAFLNARLLPGFELIARASNLETRIAEADVVISAEGKVDSQTLSGKTPMGVARLAKRYGKPLLVFTGEIGEGIETLYEQGLTAVFSIQNGPMTLLESKENAAALLESCVENVFRALMCHEERFKV